jgi:hypothetical protein
LAPISITTEPGHSGKPTNHEGGCGEYGARRPGRHQAVDIARFDQASCHRDGGIPLLANGDGGIVGHVDHLTGVDNREVDAGRGESRLETSPVTDQDYLMAPLGGVDSTVDDLRRGVVTAHGIDSDGGHGITASSG